jgi:hypothetical protein
MVAPVNLGQSFSKALQLDDHNSSTLCRGTLHTCSSTNDELNGRTLPNLGNMQKKEGDAKYSTSLAII